MERFLTMMTFKNLAIIFIINMFVFSCGKETLAATDTCTRIHSKGIKSGDYISIIITTSFMEDCGYIYAVRNKVTSIYTNYPYWNVSGKRVYLDDRVIEMKKYDMDVMFNLLRNSVKNNVKNKSYGDSLVEDGSYYKVEIKIGTKITKFEAYAPVLILEKASTNAERILSNIYNFLMNEEKYHDRFLRHPTVMLNN